MDDPYGRIGDVIIFRHPIIYIYIYTPKCVCVYSILILNRDSFCRVTGCSPHLDGNREWAQRAQYNKFVRESGLKNWANRFSRQLLGVGYLAEEAKTHE